MNRNIEHEFRYGRPLLSVLLILLLLPSPFVLIYLSAFIIDDSYMLWVSLACFFVPVAIAVLCVSATDGLGICIFAEKGVEVKLKSECVEFEYTSVSRVHLVMTRFGGYWCIELDNGRHMKINRTSSKKTNLALNGFIEALKSRVEN